jgi:UDP-N-acetylglucosamine 1-carboxyvinyltransferase
MAAALLTPETVTLHNIPYVRDIITQRRLLEDIGATVLTPELRTHKITAAHIEVFEAPYELVKTMRASVLALGPLLARFGKAKVSLPGGCAIGTRPIDLHLSGFEKFGAVVKLEAGNVVARAPADGRLRAADVHFNKVTVTGTENLMMAATLARGTTTLRNAACEPEIVDLADLLNKMGARVNGAGTETIQIEGVEALGAAEHTIIPDRIETGTFIVAAAITCGELEIKDCRPDHLASVISQLRSAVVDGPTPLTGARVIASDLRASASLVLAGLIANGETVIDRVYHIDRGYEKIEAKLRTVGAEIERIRAPVTTSQLQEVQPIVEAV